MALETEIALELKMEGSQEPEEALAWEAALFPMGRPQAPMSSGNSWEEDVLPREAVDDILLRDRIGDEVLLWNAGGGARECRHGGGGRGQEHTQVLFPQGRPNTPSSASLKSADGLSTASCPSDDDDLLQHPWTAEEAAAHARVEQDKFISLPSNFKLETI
ncbi:hypothetical protein GUITHDRAFT_99170 [Guillardia theta CCMP2712]|uniref:Uncharacterized protein n=1 Tax=Guillardia theta (strain CCMP2712) TaxID=905079 RepID=L1K485_GUITC|nr:hypothetical protein GUITHDRAFT_99170 [Guillardia theta CCMP2712]EKX55387.1 hypothetical protein GUITHDRAFT_99170 [Guillardia theta CCMP2712]|eukprot:XP_005842367.1 hypothetical protein GUITHDRAFT_99170 [Guillardia theta CCMP2712]